MNLDSIRNLVEFKSSYDYIVSMQWKFNTIKYYRDAIVLLDSDKVEDNIEAIVNEVRKMGYEIKDVKDYTSLYKALTDLLADINKEVNHYLLNKMFDKVIEKSIKDMFYVKK